MGPKLLSDVEDQVELRGIGSAAEHTTAKWVAEGHLDPEISSSLDPLDPLHWSWFQKHTILSIVMALYFMFTYITTMTVPSFASIQTQYSISIEQVNWTVAVPALGLAVGPLLCSSIADIIGRRAVMIIGTAIGLISTIWAALAPTYSGYMAARFFQGLGVSPAATVGLAIINDLFAAEERGTKVGLWALAIDTGLLFGPLVGGFASLAGHLWVQWLAAIMFGIVWLLEIFFLPETLYPRSSIANKSRVPASAAGVDGDAANIRRELDTGMRIPRTKELGWLNLKPLPGMVHPGLTDTFTRFLKTFKFASVSVSIGVYCFAWYWWVMSVITVIPIAYPQYSPQVQGLLFLGLIIGTLISELCFSGRLSDWLVGRLATRNKGVRVPEMRLYLSYPSAILTAVGLVVWGISVDRKWHWATGQVALAVFGAGIQIGNTAVCTYMVDAYPRQAMAFVVFYTVLLNLSAFVDPFFIIPWLDKVGFTWCFTSQALITLVFCMPVLALLHYFGQRVRQRCGEPDWVDPGTGAQ